MVEAQVNGERRSVAVLLCVLIKRARELVAIDVFVFEFKQKTAYDIASCLVRSDMCIRGSVEVEDKKILKGLDLDVEKGNPVQLHACPWCGATLNAWQYEITNEPRMRVRCRDKSCDFAGGLPVYMVDEDVYVVGGANSAGQAGVAFFEVAGRGKLQVRGSFPATGHSQKLIH